jgi:hypothetical protein
MDDYCRIVLEPYLRLCNRHGIGLKDYDSMAHAAILRHSSSLSIQLLKETCPQLDLSSLTGQLSR